MEYCKYNKNNKVLNKAYPLVGGVKLTNGRLKEVFDNNISFLKSFDFDRMMYWFRVASNKPAPNAPYGFSDCHFENNLFGQTAGMFLMCAATALLWKEDNDLRSKMDKIVDEIAEFMPDDGCLLPVKKEERFTLEYPNYVRAWFNFGLIAAGNAGNKKAFELLRKFGDWFNNAEELPMVKDMNLGFQGILANTELFLSPVGNDKDLEVAQRYYREDWWLKLLENKNHDAICRHPNHPHGTVLTALEGYLDIYRITGEEYLLKCVKNALAMVEEKWQHVGGGIVMCEERNEPHYPGCNYLIPTHSYNELCCTTFWILLNQRMALLEPENPHYYDQIEDSVYNMLAAAQVDDIGYHYLGFLEGSKDLRYTDKATCCAATGSRLVSMLPQLLFTYKDDAVFVNLYSSSTASIDGDEISVETDMPYGGRVDIKINKWSGKKLYLRIPNWCKAPVTVLGVTANAGEYLKLENLAEGTVLSFELEFKTRTTLYSGANVIAGKERYAFQYGPLLLAALRSKDAFFNCDINNFDLKKAENGHFVIDNNQHLELMPYMDIKDEPFTVYPVIELN